MGFTGPLPENFLKRMTKEDRAPLGKAGLTLPEIAEKHRARSEKELQEQIISYLRLQGIKCPFRARMDKKTTIAKGHPDIWFCLGGRACAIEVKIPGKYPTDEQERVMDQMREDGWRVAVVWNLEAVVVAVREWRENPEPN